MATDPVRVRVAQALYVLVTSTESVQERVSAAWLELLPLQREQFPSELQAAFGVLEAEMLAAPDDPAELTDEAAVAAAERVLRLALELWGP